MTPDFPIGRRSLLLGAAVLALGLGTRPARAAAAAPGDVVLTLPAPTGRHPVGCRSVYLVDTSRRDPWDSSVPVRELMLTFFYPARDVTGLVPAPQLPPPTANAFGQVAPYGPLHLPAAGVDWAATLSHAFADAPALPGRRPVLLYSPGGGDPRGLGTSLAEDLAGHGAVVVTVDHPGDGAAVEFPGTTVFRDEPVRTTVFRGDPRDRPDVFRTMIDARVADLRFVLDRLARPAELPLPRGLAGAIDWHRIGLYGHSAGGSAAAEVLFEDRRVRAAVNLEGYLDHPPLVPGGAPEPFPVTRYGVDRPLLLLGTEGFDRRPELDRSWSALTARSGRWVRTARIADAGHWVFTDCAATIPQLQAAGLTTRAERNAVIGRIAPTVSIPKVRHLVRGFFEEHLGGW
ncbi:alpha/beta hydrolase [Kitasatospora sp. CB02891]|uniref:alpha/beta hydrolase family protein n=1 Tax=Kitasatospora sp. CB02891 TaxID=2020329 RepID=UPI000C26E34C|nr:alpha/beta hydrolase [Kitasatospora sp. CB02891]PJN23137.1 alpha/beta hydrolase [Kitasatospora sp. CB02891]